MSETIGPHPTLADVVRKHIRVNLTDLHVAIPARVERVDLAKGLIDAKPLVKDSHDDAEGNRVPVSVPVICNVPVIFPGVGGMRITFPISKGDTVMLLFSERSLDTWLVRGGEVDPVDDRRHQLSDAVAIPGLRDFAHPWKGTSSSAVTIGQDGATQHGAGMGDRLRTELDAVWNAITNHIHLAACTGGTTTVSPTTTPAVKQVVESATVKITG
jgi:hypothetical protein